MIRHAPILPLLIPFFAALLQMACQRLAVQRRIGGVACAVLLLTSAWLALLAAGIGVASWPWGRPFLTSAHGELTVPLLGPIGLASAMVFDLGVYVVVVTVALAVLSGLGTLSLRAHRGST